MKANDAAYDRCLPPGIAVKSNECAGNPVDQARSVIVLVPVSLPPRLHVVLV